MPPIYDFYIEDDRYSVPTLDFVTAASDDHARRLAKELLQSSPHRHSVEVWLGGSPLFTVQLVETTPEAARGEEINISGSAGTTPEAAPFSPYVRTPEVDRVSPQG